MIRPVHLTVILLVGADGDAVPAAVLGSESTPLTKLLADAGGAVETRVISLGSSGILTGADLHVRLDPGSRSRLDRVLRALGGYALRQRLEGFPIGRLLNTLGPLDPSRVFWRTLRGNPEAVRLLRTSDVAIATDLETTKTAWIAIRRGWVEQAHYDHRALASAGGAA